MCPPNSCAVPSITHTGENICSPPIDAEAFFLPGARNFPEDGVQSVQRKFSSGIAFSGGGNRAYTASLGVAMAFEHLNLMQNIRYMSAVSGGSWFTGVYTYGRTKAGRPVKLPPVIPLKQLTPTVLNKPTDRISDPPTQLFFGPLLKKLRSFFYSTSTFEDWTEVVSSRMLIRLLYYPIDCSPGHFRFHNLLSRCIRCAKFISSPTELEIHRPSGPSTVKLRRMQGKSTHIFLQVGGVAWPCNAFTHPLAR